MLTFSYSHNLNIPHHVWQMSHKINPLLGSFIVLMRKAVFSAHSGIITTIAYPDRDNRFEKLELSTNEIRPQRTRYSSSSF